MQERDDVADFFLVQFSAKLCAAHAGDRILKVPQRNRVEVRRGECDVTQCRGLEREAVALHVRYGEPANVTDWQQQRVGLLHYAEREVTVTTQVDALVAGYTATPDESLESGALLLVEHARVTFQELIETGVRREQGAFERLDRPGDVEERHRVIVLWERSFEQRHVIGHAFDGSDDPLRCVVHLERILDRAHRLVGEVLSASVPELGDVEHGVEHGWGVAAAALPGVTDRAWLQIHAGGADVVATVAAYEPAGRKACVEPECPAQQLLLVTVLVAFDGRRFGGDDIEQCACSYEQAVSCFLLATVLGEGDASGQQSDDTGGEGG